MSAEHREVVQCSSLTLWSKLCDVQCDAVMTSSTFLNTCVVEYFTPLVYSLSQYKFIKYCYIILARDFALKEKDVIQPYKVSDVLPFLTFYSNHIEKLHTVYLKWYTSLFTINGRKQVIIITTTTTVKRLN